MSSVKSVTIGTVLRITPGWSTGETYDVVPVQVKSHEALLIDVSSHNRWSDRSVRVRYNDGVVPTVYLSDIRNAYEIRTVEVV